MTLYRFSRCGCSKQAVGTTGVVLTAVVCVRSWNMTRYARGGQSLERWCSVPSPAHRAGGGSMDSAHLYHGMTVGAQNLRLAGLSAINRGVGVGVVGDMRGGAVGGGNEIGYTVALARGARGGLVETVGITMVEHVGRFLPLIGGQLNSDRVSNELQ